jgi:hypothetical protein
MINDNMGSQTKSQSIILQSNTVHGKKRSNDVNPYIVDSFSKINLN